MPIRKDLKKGPSGVKSVFRRFAIDLGIRVGYGTAFFILLISHLLTLSANSELLKQAKLVDHTNQLIIHLEELSSSVKDAETGIRGFLLMGKEEFLQPYYPSQRISDSVFKLIQSESSGDNYEENMLATLHNLVERKYRYLADLKDFYSRHNREFEDSMKTITWFGKELMDHIRGNVLLMRTHEQILLKERSGELNTRYITLNTISIASLITAFLLLMYGFTTYARENKARRKADETVLTYQDELKERINELGRANSDLIQMRSIEKLAATGRIARTIAHEVRNPLTNINLSVDQLKSEAGIETQSISVMLDMILRNSDRINQLITALLNSTKFTELVFQRIEINQLVDETLELAKDRISLNNIQVVKEYSKKTCIVSVDMERIKIALLNIIVNAIEAMEPDKGVLVLRTESQYGKCVVTIADNGSGMDKESLAKLFEPYFTSKNQGTGLGLTNAQNIILNHRGFIHAESEKGHGCSFIITLNLA